MDNSYNLNEQSSWNGISSEKKKNYLASEDHGQKILSVLQSFREQNVFYDFKIIMKEEIIPCHRCVLAACSDFFRAMFEVNMKERDDGSVTITNLSSKAVKAFLDYAYTGKTRITDDNVEMFFQLSSFLQVSFLSKACSDKIMVLDSGRLKEYDEPYVLLQNPESLFYKMVQQLGKGEAAALTETAKQVYFRRNYPDITFTSPAVMNTSNGQPSALTIFETAL